MVASCQITGRLEWIDTEFLRYEIDLNDSLDKETRLVEETAEELVLTAELPGLTDDDIEIELENSVLTIRGEKNAERHEGDESKKYHVWERSYGSFQRSFTLPRTVAPDKIEADFEKGVLHVRMPKAPEAKGRRIAIGGREAGTD